MQIVISAEMLQNQAGKRTGAAYTLSSVNLATESRMPENKMYILLKSGGIN